MKKLNCKHVSVSYLNETSVRLNLKNISDEELPTVSIVTPTRNRHHFNELMIRNWKKIDYPRDKLEWIILDESDTISNSFNELENVRYIHKSGKMKIGEKRNKLAELAAHEYIVHMDDDDWYPPESVSARIRILLDHQESIGTFGCFGCTKSLCMDLVTNQMFEAYDASIDNEPATISESTMAYSKNYWTCQKFNDDSVMVECLDFIKDREETVCSGPSVFVVVQFSHLNNTVQRRVKRNTLSIVNGQQFLNSMTMYDSVVYENIRASIIKELPNFKESIKTIEMSKNLSLNKFKNFVSTLSRDILRNPLFIDFMRFKLKSKEKSSGKDVVYYCGPGSYLPFTNEWNPETENLGGSEEAVISLSYELAARGYNVTVYCVLPENSKKRYTNSKGIVNYRNYWEWSPYDVNDYNIIWRDPSNCALCKNGKTFLDLHDALDPSYLSNVPKDVTIMTKSAYHKKILGPKADSATVVPNGIYPIEPKIKKPYVMLCTSSPDRCLGALLRMLPIVRTEIPDAEIHWAYGFGLGVVKGGMEADSRPEVSEWVSKMKELIKNTEGFVNLGRVSLKEIDDLYATADVFVYPTQFPEIDCISLTKAMSAGAIPVVTPSGAMSEKIGIDFQCATESNSIDSSLKEGELFNSYVHSLIRVLKSERKDIEKMKTNVDKMYNWQIIADQWIKKLNQ